MKRKIRKIKRKLAKSNILLLIIATIIIIAIIIALIIGKSILTDNNDYDNLIKESKTINNSIKIDKIDNKYINKIKKERITNNKENQLLEDAIEEYTIDYIKTINSTTNCIKDEKYANLLTATNYQTDGPAFNNSIEYLNNKKEEIHEANNELNKIIDKTYYTKYIKEKTKNKSLINKYLLLIKNIINTEEIDLLINDLDNVQTILTISNDIFAYLGRNSTAYHIENNEIVFTDQQVKTEYEKAINKIKR